MISHSERQAAEAVVRAVQAEGGYMFHERDQQGGWRHGFERLLPSGELTREFSEATMLAIRRNRSALHVLAGERLASLDRPRGLGSSGGSGVLPQSAKVAKRRSATRTGV